MVLGIIGGSGLYNLGLGDPEPIELKTPYGSPSGTLQKLALGKHEFLFVARHGASHSISPSNINYRANVYGLKKLGAQAVVSISAVGSLKESIEPGHFVLPGQYIDLTKGLRPNTFFDKSIVGHIEFADPVCAALRKVLSDVISSLDIPLHVEGTYVCMEGPQFSTRAESHLYRHWDASVIGMTALPEARLAREAGLSYQTVAMATDYDCWNTEQGDVSVEEVVRVAKANVEKSRKIVKALSEQDMPDFKAQYAGKMRRAIMTPESAWPASERETLEVILS